MVARRAWFLCAVSSTQQNSTHGVVIDKTYLMILTHQLQIAGQALTVSTRNPKYNAAIRHYHLPRKSFQTLGQHHWMQPTAAMKRLAPQSLAATV
jgi:hypothetical protein